MTAGLEATKIALAGLADEVEDVAAQVNRLREVTSSLGGGEASAAFSASVELLADQCQIAADAFDDGVGTLSHLIGELNRIEAEARPTRAEHADLEQELRLYCYDEPLHSEKQNRLAELTRELESLRFEEDKARQEAARQFEDSGRQSSYTEHPKGVLGTIGSGLWNIGSGFIKGGVGLVTSIDDIILSLPGTIGGAYDRTLGFIHNPERGVEAWQETLTTADLVWDYYWDQATNNSGEFAGGLAFDVLLGFLTRGSGNAIKASQFAEKTRGLLNKTRLLPSGTNKFAASPSAGLFASDSRIDIRRIDLDYLDSPGDISRSEIWELPALGVNPDGRGIIAEGLTGQLWQKFDPQIGALPPNTPRIDLLNRDSGHVVSVKSLDLNATSYTLDTSVGRSALKSRLKSYIEDIQSYDGMETAWVDVQPIHPADIQRRTLDLVVPQGSLTPEHADMIRDVFDELRIETRQVDLTITEL